MAAVRFIARLDVKGPNLVKGVHLEGLRVLGKPEDFARHYYENGIDELIFMDVVASLYGRNSLLDIIRKTSSEIFIPLSVGGGLRSIEDIRAVLAAGADKVCLNTAAIANPELVREASRCFGSSTIVVSIEAIRQPDGSYEAYTDNGRQKTGVEAVGWARRAAELGAGEIMITSVDREGTGQGYDLALTKSVASAVDIPVIACGGAGRKEHVGDAVTQGWANAVGVASLLHYNVLDVVGGTGSYEEEGNIEYLKGRRGFSHVERSSLGEIKEYLRGLGLECR